MDGSFLEVLVIYLEYFSINAAGDYNGFSKNYEIGECSSINAACAYMVFL